MTASSNVERPGRGPAGARPADVHRQADQALLRPSWMSRSSLRRAVASAETAAAGWSLRPSMVLRTSATPVSSARLKPAKVSAQPRTTNGRVTRQTNPMAVCRPTLAKCCRRARSAGRAIGCPGLADAQSHATVSGPADRRRPPRDDDAERGHRDREEQDAVRESSQTGSGRVES